MAWLLLIVAGVLEVVFASSLKPAEGFTRLWPSVAVVVFGTAAVVVLTRSLAQIPVSTAYAVFTGIGAVGTTFVAAAAYGESLTAARLACIALVVAGVVGLRLAGAG
ncbi:MAG TPA: multidrug efflux SMR transporter [Acidimicrobiales bacterium]|nr:multidrug efflux SMR transporter [Acidimicrobiales bacterium]